MKNFFATVLDVLKQDKRFFAENGTFLRNSVYEAAMQMDKDLIHLLVSNDETKARFFTEVDGVFVFDKVGFAWVINNREFLPDSYTRFKNKIGLIDENGDMIATSGKVELVFPYKDCVLEGGQTKEDQKRSEIFYNETLAPDEIDRLLYPKVLVNVKRVHSGGVDEHITEFRDDDNLIIKGNNLLALASLLKRYERRVKCIYIDPPYNTGSDSFGYNDNFNHSSWLAFMKNRLIMAHKLLRPDGVIYVQCDDNEQAYLKVLMDGIFGESNFISTIAYQRSGVAGLGQGGSFVVNVTEYITVFAKDKSLFSAHDMETAVPLEKKHMQRYNSILRTVGQKELYRTFISKSTGEEIKIYKHKNYKIESISLRNFSKREDEIRDIYDKNYDYIYRLNVPQDENTFQWDIINSFDDDELYSVEYLVSRGKSKGKVVTNYYYKKQLFAWLNTNREAVEKGIKLKALKTNKMSDFWTHGEIPKADLANEGGVKLKRGKKPEQLLRRIISISTEEKDLVLDFFLGSGTTAAVAHKMNRRYIGIEQLDYANNDSITRLENVIKGDRSGISNTVGWNGGGSFVYCELAKLNQNFVDEIQVASKTTVLKDIYSRMVKSGFISCKVDPADIEATASDFESLSLDDQKRFLMELLDKNLLYVNYCDMDDEDFEISKADKAFTRSFYKEV